MRLIDADKIRFKDLSDGHVPNGIWYCLLDEIKSQPTVKAIPLDKPFCKMVYGDYVCYNRKWLMKHLQMEIDILQGKAIPIEWLKSYVQKLKTRLKDNLDLGEDGPTREIVTIEDMLDDWEKENEQDRSGV